MSKLILSSFVAALATLTLMSTAKADIVSTTLDCSSVGDAYTECDAGFAFTDAKLISEDVSGTCVYGSTWGTYDHSVWVNHGCSGRFTVSGEGQTTTPVPVPTPRQPVSASVDCRFNNVNWQPYNRYNNFFIGRPGFGFQDANQCAYSVQLARRNAVCNWTGAGFTPYDVDSNAALYAEGYANVDQCYAAIR